MQAGQCATAECSGPTLPGYDWCYYCFQADLQRQELAAAQAERQQKRAESRRLAKERKAAKKTVASYVAKTESSSPPSRAASKSNRSCKAAVPTQARTKKPKTAKKKTAPAPEPPKTYWVCEPCGIAMEGTEQRCSGCGRPARGNPGRTRAEDRMPRGPVAPSTPVPLPSSVAPGMALERPTGRALIPPRGTLPDRDPGWWQENDRW